MGLFFLGEKLGKTISELQHMSGWEFAHWMAYYRVKAEEQEKADKKSGKGGNKQESKPMMGQ